MMCVTIRLMPVTLVCITPVSKAPMCLKPITKTPVWNLCVFMTAMSMNPMRMTHVIHVLAENDLNKNSVRSPLS